MKKKGFTLIELLAVIVILAVIALIAVPIILNMINDAKKGAAVDSAYGYIQAIEANNALAQVNNGKYSLIPDGEYNDFDLLMDINVKGKIPDYIEYTVEKGRIKEAGMCFNKTNVYYDGSKALIKGSYCANATVKSIVIENKQEKIENGDTLNLNVKIEKETDDEIIPIFTSSNPEVATIQEDGTIFALSVGKTIIKAKAGAKGDKFELEVTPKFICKRATELNSARNSNWDLHTFGNLGTKGILTSGDAYDCDVDGTGYNKRFYYVSDYYDTSSKTFNDEYAVLIYNYNVINGEKVSNGISAYHNVAENWHGPVEGIKNLPTTSQWKRVKLYKEKRQILDEKNNTKVRGHDLPTEFSYSGYAARLLTMQELKVASKSESSLEKALFLAEKTSYYNRYSDEKYASGYWLETPWETSVDDRAFYVESNLNIARNTGITNKNYYGIRPVIEIKKSDMEI